MKMMKRLNSKTATAVYLVIVAIVMYGINVFTPIFCDDWHYRFIFGTQTPIRTIGDILVSQWHHYFEFTNGRFFAHFFVQLFDGILGKGIFNVFNALAFAAFLYLLAVVTARERKHDYKIVSVAFILIFLLMTGFKYVFLWMSGACNYLWMALLLLPFHHLIEREDVPAKYNWLLLLFGFVCGWTNEAMVVGLGAAYFLYFAFHRKELTGHRRYMLAGFFIGALFLVFAPSSINRAFTSSARHFTLMDRIVNMQNLTLFYVLVLFILAKAIFGKLRFKEWVKKEQMLITATLVSLFFILFTGFYLEHSRFGIELFSLMLVLRVINWDKINTAAITVCNVCMIVFAAYVVTVCAKCYNVGQQELAPAKTGGTLILTTNPIRTTSPLRRYVIDYYGYGLHGGLDEEKYYGGDDWIPDYYGYHGQLVYMLPRHFINDLNQHPELYDDFRTLDQLPFYAIRVSPQQNIWYAELSYHPSKYNRLPWPLNRIFMKFKNDTDWDISDITLLTINGQRYALIRRPRPSQDYRLKSIELVEHGSEKAIAMGEKSN